MVLNRHRALPASRGGLGLAWSAWRRLVSWLPLGPVRGSSVVSHRTADGRRLPVVSFSFAFKPDQRTEWSAADLGRPVCPPILYVDDQAVIREVHAVGLLRRGDHCLIPLNLIRTVSPGFDTMLSKLGSWELFRLYHHFLMIDDVAYVDQKGVPRRADGDFACLIEYSSTPQCAYETVLGPTGTGLTGIINFFMDKCSYNIVPLCDYSDMPHIFKLVEPCPPTEQERDTIVARALRFQQQHPTFNVFSRNCEHSTNQIIKKQWHSPQVSYVAWNTFRSVISLVGIVFLYRVGVLCYGRLCPHYPVGAVLGYHLFTSVPVLIQSLVHLVRAMVNLSRYAVSVDSDDGRAITRDDYLHLVGKEIGRLVIVGGGTLTVIALMPMMIFDTRLVLAACVICVCAFACWNWIYSLLAQGVTRLLVLLFGKYWLIEPKSSPPAKHSHAR